MKKFGLVFCLLASASWLSGCIPVVVTGAATTTGVVAAQERSAGNAMDDTGIKLTIDNLFLQYDVNDMFKNVNVHVSEGRVLLTGAVDKPDTKIQAVRLAWRAKGTREVIDEIQVNPNSGAIDFARDTWISAQVRSRLLLEKNVRSVNFAVETVDGVVYLLGIAQDEEELRKVTYIASTTRYVKQVISHVIMKDDPRRRPYGKQGDPYVAGAEPGAHDHPVPGGNGQPETTGGQPETTRTQPAPGGDGGGQPETRERLMQEQ